MPSPSTIQITYDHPDDGVVDITAFVLAESTSFELQYAATPGSAEVTVSDPDQILDFVTGRELRLFVDNVPLWGGYVTYVSRKHAFDAGDTVTNAPYPNYRLRQWVLRCVDYNILFDKRVLHDPNNTRGLTADFSITTPVSTVVRYVVENYIDVPSNIDVDSGITFDTQITDGNEGGRYQLHEQGTQWREVMDDLSRFGCVYYITADRVLVVQGVEETAKNWDFSDKPRPEVRVIGFREFETIEDSTLIVNDALVWGGSPFALGGQGGTVFARRENAASITDHGRWQYGETDFNDPHHGSSQTLVNERANVIVDGTRSGAVAGETGRGLVNPEKQVTCVWFAHDVPYYISGEVDSGKAYLVPSDIIYFFLYTLGIDEAHPLILRLPLRQVSITFPSLSPDGGAWVRFEGMFGLQLDDPYWLWAYLRKGPISPTFITPTANEGSQNPLPGSYFRGPLTPAPDGVNTVFLMAFPYTSGTTQVYINGLIQNTSVYTESDPSTGEITFYTAPLITDSLWIICRTA